MKPRTRFAILALIPLGCATGENTELGDGGLGTNGGSSESTGAGSGGSATTSGGSVGVEAGTGATGVAGTGFATAGTFSAAGTFATAGSGGSGGSASGGTAGAPTGGVSGSGGSTVGAAGKSTGGAGGSTTAGSGGTGGTAPVTAYCDNQTKSPLPYTVNEGFQPSGWQGDTAAISAAPVVPNACDTRAAGSVGACSVWTYTPNATTPAWAGVSWSKVWDPSYTHPPVCIAAGATKVTFQARGAKGGEQVTFSAAGALELPFTLTNAWKEYQVSLAGIQYNTPDDGVDSGFFWKVAPPTPGGAPVTFFVDDIQFVK
jgi:hypothetical protein